MTSFDNKSFIGEIDTVQSKLIWEIKDFVRVSQQSQGLMISPYFNTIFESRERKWILTLFKNIIYDENEVSKSIVLFPLSNEDRCKISVDFGILNINNEEVFKNKSQEFSDDMFQMSVPSIKFPVYSSLGFIKKDVLEDQKLTLLDKGALKIICTITIDNYTQVEKQKIENGFESFLRFEESKHLLNLLLTGKFSDVVFSVEGRQICAHKSIIANRSSVFDAMFTHNTIEAKNNVIVVEDITYSTMHDLLKFIYSGTVPVYTETEQYDGYKNLMIAANKYSISNLKRECERRLSNSLKVDNVFECLKFADIHDASNLKENTIGFIACKGHEIIASPVYKEFGNLCPELASEVFRAVVKRMKTE